MAEPDWNPDTGGRSLAEILREAGIESANRAARRRSWDDPEETGIRQRRAEAAAAGRPGAGSAQERPVPRRGRRRSPSAARPPRAPRGLRTAVRPPTRASMRPGREPGARRPRRSRALRPDRKPRRPGRRARCPSGPVPTAPGRRASAAAGGRAAAAAPGRRPVESHPSTGPIPVVRPEQFEDADDLDSTPQESALAWLRFAGELIIALAAGVGVYFAATLLWENVPHVAVLLAPLAVTALVAGVGVLAAAAGPRARGPAAAGDPRVRRHAAHDRARRRAARRRLLTAGAAVGPASSSSASSARELLDDRGAERVQVVGLAAGDRGCRRRRPPRPPSRRPALRRSVCSDGHDVMRRPLTTSASTSTHGAWQMAATGLPASKNAFTKATASASARTKSPLMTPPGRTSAAVRVRVGRADDGVDLLGVALVDVVVGGDRARPRARPAPARRRPPRAPATAGPARPARRRPWPARPPSSRSVLLPCSAPLPGPRTGHTPAHYGFRRARATQCQPYADRSPLRAAGRRAPDRGRRPGRRGARQRRTPGRARARARARGRRRRGVRRADRGGPRGRAGRRLRADPARRAPAGSPPLAAGGRAAPSPDRPRRDAAAGAGRVVVPADDADAEARCRALGPRPGAADRGPRGAPPTSPSSAASTSSWPATVIPRSPPPTGG